jgi:hypothetical protein
VGAATLKIAGKPAKKGSTHGADPEFILGEDCQIGLIMLRRNRRFCNAKMNLGSTFLVPRLLARGTPLVPFAMRATTAL